MRSKIHNVKYENKMLKNKYKHYQIIILVFIYNIDFINGNDPR